MTPAIGPADRAELVRAPRHDQPDLSVALRDLRPGDLPHSLRSHAVDLVLTRSRRDDDPTVQQASLHPTPVDAYLPAGHLLAHHSRLRIADLDGHTLLFASPVPDVLAGRRARPVPATAVSHPALPHDDRVAH